MFENQPKDHRDNGGSKSAALEKDISALHNEIDALQLENARSSALRRWLGAVFGNGAAQRLGWVRFKLKVKEEEMERLYNL